MFRYGFSNVCVLRCQISCWSRLCKRTYSVLDRGRVDSTFVQQSDNFQPNLTNVAVNDPNQATTLPALISKEALAKIISAREVDWINDNCVNKVSRELQMSPYKINKLLSTYPALMFLSQAHFIDAAKAIFEKESERSKEDLWSAINTNAELVRCHDIEIHRIEKAKWIWSLDLEPLKSRLMVDTVPEIKALLCSQSDTVFKRTMLRYSGRLLEQIFNEKFAILSESIDLNDRYELLNNVQKIHVLLTLAPERLKAVLQILLDEGINKEDIRGDLWICRYTSLQLRRRIRLAKDSGVPITKTWQLRCSEERFAKYMRTQMIRTKMLDPHPDTTAFLAAKLSCTEDDVKFIKFRNPAVLNINTEKLSKTIDYLLSQGYQQQEIQYHPRVLSLSLEQRTKKRVAEFQKVTNGLRLPKLHTLMLTNEEFLKLLDRTEQENGQLSQTKK